MSRNNNHTSGVGPRPRDPRREAIARALDVATVLTHLASFDQASLITQLGAYGIRSFLDGRRRTLPAATTAALDCASMLTHLLGLDDVSLILHVSACLLQPILHPQAETAVRAARTWVSRRARRASSILSHAARRLGAAVRKAGRSARNWLHRSW
ncbi:hypothetical protein [Nocardia fluminea]|uniref:Uncharacterized protein n=1 Tax=Nocardia fluminea TaxID=134984 RepID=A0A2N3WYG3_9NOCA|nr:hypothetical protein [Nocardia fluminea]PKV98895.1 hypothetical protein ATK86_0927 [Nocardia fluminea]